MYSNIAASGTTTMPGGLQNSAQTKVTVASVPQPSVAHAVLSKFLTPLVVALLQDIRATKIIKVASEKKVLNRSFCAETQATASAWTGCTANTNAPTHARPRILLLSVTAGRRVSWSASP